MSFARRITQLQDRLAPPAVWRWPVLTAAGLLSGLVWAVLTRLIETQSIHQALAALAAPFLWLTALFWALAVLAFVFLTHSLCAGNFIVGVPAVILAFVNYFKVRITSVPLSLGDFTLVGQVGNIAGLNKEALTLSRNSILAIAGAVVWLLLTLFFSRPLRIRWRRSLLGVPVSALLFWLVFWVGSNSLVFTPLGAPVSLPMSQANANQACGVPLGLWRAFYKQCTRDLGKEYSLSYMERVADLAEDYTAGLPAAPERQQPNIILVLSESFFDITTLDGVTYDQDPIAGFRALQQEGVSGTFYSRSLGYGTCNIELEILTGINTGLLSGEDLYSLDPITFSRLPSVPRLLQDSGYYTSMVHMFNDAIYHRKSFFPYLGFDDLYFTDSEESFSRIYPPAAQAEDYWAYMDSRIAGRYYSDDMLSDVLHSQYQLLSAQGTGPVFLYGISMENHSTYTDGKYKEEELTVHPQSNLTGEAAENLLYLSQGISNASDALVKLVDSFRDCDEPTVIVFFGDHRPGLGLSGGGTVYSELGMVPDDFSQWTPEQLSELYSTSYLIWSNDPDYLPAAAGSTLDTSCNYLGALLLDLAGVEQPLYWKLIRTLAQSRLVDTAEYHISTGGELTAAPPDSGEAAQGLALLTDLLNDAVYGKQYVTGRVGSVPE